MLQQLKGEALVGMELADLELLLGPKQPSFRARQLFDALYRKGVHNLSDVTNLPQGIRTELSENYPLGLPSLEHRYDSLDGSRRYLLRLHDNRTIETVLMPEAARDTICISSQVGCPVDCRFCLTALMGFERNLSAGEIVGQVLYVMRQNGLAATSSRMNIVMMGMGEPLLNLENVLKATRLLTDPNGIEISEKRITVSTSGIIPKIEELGRAVKRPKLAISLNASNEEQRRELMPITRKYHLADLIAACKSYPLRHWERLTFEYVLLGGINDSVKDARRVVRLLANLKCKLNLIALNPGPGIPFATPSPENVHNFQQTIRQALPCFIRKPRGRDIFAACGQLKRETSNLVAIDKETTSLA